MKFSERLGFTQVDVTIQTKDITPELRNSLWNVLDLGIWKTTYYLYDQNGSVGYIDKFSSKLWFDYFKLPIDERPAGGKGILQYIRNYYFNCPWYEVYDFLEFVLNYYEMNDAINKILKRELSGYRFIESTFVPVTDEMEIEAIKKAMTEGPFSGVHAHLKKAMEHLSRKVDPDYRNSIKESISAVESMARELTGNKKATLGDALSLLEKKGTLHRALKNSFSALYGYTSDEAGIRHAMLDEPNLNVADAKFFLISCSTFINYLKEAIT